MKQKATAFLIIGIVLIALVVLNAATYTQKARPADNEFSPNRSSYNPGATGTQAFYTLLSETGLPVRRWQLPTTDLAGTDGDAVGTLVIIGETRREIEDKEVRDILEWVAMGKRLILIDRSPPMSFFNTGPWRLNVRSANDPAAISIDPADAGEMSKEAAVAKAAQPTLITAGIDSVQPSRLASFIELDRMGQSIASANAEDEPPPVDVETVEGSTSAPIIHMSAGDRNIVAEIPYFAGSIVVVSDPYIVSNNGIGFLDNARLAVNLVSNVDGAIALDEYHHGFGSNNNRLFEYFAGTPVIVIFVHGAIMTALVFFSRSRRFARPIPPADDDRRSKLEYAAAMAELQQRARAFDLAIENIYGEFRRRLARLSGLDAKTAKRSELARSAAERARIPPETLEELMFKCEEIIHGEPTDRRETVELISQIRRVESSLGIGDRGRAKIG